MERSSVNNTIPDDVLSSSNCKHVFFGCIILPVPLAGLLSTMIAAFEST